MQRYIKNSTSAIFRMPNVSYSVDEKEKMMLTYTPGCSLMSSMIENPFLVPTLTVFSVSSAVKFTVGVELDSVMSAPAKDGITVTL